MRGTTANAQKIVATLNMAGDSEGMKKRCSELSMPINAAATATVVLLALLSLAAFGLEPWVAFFQNLPTASQSTLELGRAEWGKLQSAYGVVRMMGGASALAWTVQGVLAGAVTVALVALWRGKAPFELKAAMIAQRLPRPFREVDRAPAAGGLRLDQYQAAPPAPGTTTNTLMARLSSSTRSAPARPGRVQPSPATGRFAGGARSVRRGTGSAQVGIPHHVRRFGSSAGGLSGTRPADNGAVQMPGSASVTM